MKFFLGFLLIITVLSGSYFFYSNNFNHKTILSCEETFDTQEVLTTKTSELMNGKEQIRLLNEIKEKCNENKIARECTDDSRTCKLIAGIKAKTINECNNEEDCLSGFAAAHIEDCSKFEGKNKNMCLFSRAYITNNVEDCGQIKEISFDEIEPTFSSVDYSIIETFYYNRNKCLWGISDRLNDVQVCETMNESTEKDVCFLSYSLKNKKVDYCSKISPKNQKFKILCEKYNELSEEEKNKGVLYL